MFEGDDISSSGRSGFVGRKRELAEIVAGLEDARAGRVRLFLVNGEPGIGKSRLTEEVAGHAVSRGFLVLRARCWDGGGTPAYWPFVQLIRGALGGADGDALLQHLGSKCAAHVIQDAAQLIPELQASIAASVHPSAQSLEDVEQARFRLFESIATIVKVLAGLQPLMLVVDDLHDADQPSLVMLRFVVSHLKNAPVLVVGNYRDVEVQRSPVLSRLLGDLVREGVPIPLLGLKREDAAQMIEERAGAPSSLRLVSDIHQATAGNPLFIDGLVRVLAADGTLGSTDRLDLAAFRVPDGVREAIRRWLAVLSDRSSLIIAATIGQQFELRCLQRVTQLPNHQLLDALREAETAGVLTSVSPGRYRFTHALIRKALCEELNSADSAESHLRIGEAIEQLYRVEVEVHAAALAHHFREGGDIDKAIEYSIRAGEAARTVFAYAEAVAHWHAALELMPERAEDRERRANLLERTGQLLALTESEGETQFRYMREALRLYNDAGHREAAVRVEVNLAGFLMLRGHAADVSRALERNQGEYSLIGQDRKTLIASAWRHSLEATAAFEGLRIERTLSASRRAMEISEHLGEAVIWVRTAIPHTGGLLAKGQLAKSLALIRRVLNEADRLNDNIATTGILALSSSMLFWLCDPSPVSAQVRRELTRPRLAEARALRGTLIGSLCGLEFLGGNLGKARELAIQAPSEPRLEGQLAFYAGEWEQAELALGEAVRHSREAGTYIRACISSHWLARLFRVLLRHSASEAILQENVVLCVEGPHVPLELQTRSELASLYAETQRPDLALPHADRCREIVAAGEDWRGLAGHVARAEAVVAAAQGRLDVANQQFTHAAEIYRRYQVPFEEAETLHYWGRALLTAGIGGQALEKLDLATELYQRHGAGQRWLDRVQADRLRARSAGRTVEGGQRVARVRELGDPPEGRNAGEQRKDMSVEGAFLKSGKYWNLSWAGSSLMLKDRKGLRCVAYLLRHPGQEFPAQELVSAAQPAGNGCTATYELADSLNQVDTIARNLGDNGAALDATAKAQYRHRLDDLREELELAERRNDLGQAARTRFEIEFITDQLTASIGLHGRDRKIASHAERARVAATKSIKSALNQIREADTELARHLALSIKTGYFCGYLPKSPVNWRL